MSHYNMPSLPVIRSNQNPNVTLADLVYRWVMRQLGL
jgi:hypothetical protein